MFKFLKSGPAKVVTLALLLQATLLYSSIRPEAVPPGRPLADFPHAIGPWRFVQEVPVDQETRDVLKADDLLNDGYMDSSGLRAYLFIAAFRSQRTGKAPHSPKNCMPGSGWTPMVQDQIQIDVGAPAPIPVNRYIVARDQARSVVLYWYQSRDRAVASEYTAKFWVVADAIRLNRTDTALVRVVVPIANGDSDRAERVGVDFVKASYSTIRAFLPS